LDSSLGQDDDSHILLTAGLEAPLKQELLILNLNDALSEIEIHVCCPCNSLLWSSDTQ